MTDQGRKELLKDQIASLTPAQRALFEQRLRRLEGGPPAAQRIPRSSERTQAPLSFAQQRLWFLDQLEPGSPFYNMALAFRVRGPLRTEVLRRALEALIHRHEALRTTFRVVDDRRVQAIDAESPLNVATSERSGVPEASRDRVAVEWISSEARRPFDLAVGPLFRASLLRFAEEDHVLLLGMHHIVSDGWSLGILMNELAHYYEALSGGSAAELPELPVQYADFARWQRQWLTGTVLEEQLSYWRRQLADLPALELSTDRPRPREQTFRGGRYRIVFPPALTGPLKALSRSEGATLYMTLLAAFQALLLRYTGQEDIAVGSPIAGRNRSEIEGLIGFFVNTLVLRTDLSGDPTFRELLRRVREVALGAYAHQDMPFERLVEELQPDRDLGQNPLFQVTFALQNAPGRDTEFPGIALKNLSVDSGVTRFDLEVHLSEGDDGLHGNFVYSTDLFDAPTIERMASHFQTLLEGIVADPDRNIGDLPLLSDSERLELVSKWNTTGIEYPPGGTVHGWFERQAARTPDTVAVVFEAESLTYGELNERSNRLGRYLVGRGVGPDVLVGLCMERSIEMVVGLLGILKAGGAYLPLDPGYPVQRLKFMLDDAAAAIVLTQERLVDFLPEGSFERLRLDMDWPEIERESDENPRSLALEEHLAYVIYTSGSTGTPKGVEVSHAAILNHMFWMQSVFPLTDRDRVLQKTPISFDASVWEFLAPLLAGAGLVMANPGDHRDAAALVRTIVRHDVTVLQVVPTLLQMLLEEERLRECVSLKRVFCGGETLTIELRDRFFASLSAELHNLYGPTEASIDATSWTCRRGDAEAPIPIGRPISNTQVFILDARMRPVPVGVIGELFIGGAGLARRYLRRPDLTATRFIPDPFTRESGARLYRTGDRARYRADGAIIFLGRTDEQVKIRGYRIELGEIKAALDSHPAVASSVVVVREDTPGERRIVAYVVLAASSAADESLTASERPDGVDQWRAMYEQLYSAEEAADPTFNTVGWNSSYTGERLPDEDMQEWVDDTVARVLSLRPGRVLEIGAGTGLILFRVAPVCSLYTATDFSPPVIAQLEAFVRRADVRLDHVRLLARSAEDFEGLPPSEFDTVVLNSVIQYFPDVDYLLRVMRGAVDALADGGSLFVGDVRSLPLLEAFHLSVELDRAPDSLPVDELRRRVRRAMAQEEELVVDPAFFAALHREIPRIAHVEVLPKTGRQDNELNRYRYDVILRIGPVLAAESPETWREGGGDDVSGESIRTVLSEERPTSIGFAHVRNARLGAHRAALELLDGPNPVATAGALRAALSRGPGQGLDPGEAESLGAALGYRAHLDWSRSSPLGDFDLAFRREPAPAPLRFPGPQGTARPWGDYANHPLRAALARQLLPRLRLFLKERLPEYMVPAAVVLLDSLPLTANGKVDRRALPSSDLLSSARERDSDFVAPRNPVEEVLAAIWADVLGVEDVGVRDEFFALGGHSLLATQVISRVREAFRVDLPLRALFETPTVAGLASKISSVRQEREGLSVPALTSDPRDRETLSFAQQRLWFLDQLEPGNASYATSRAIRLTGNLDLRALVSAFGSIVQRHESLRTRFGVVEGRPVQVIAPDARFELPSFDLSALPAEDLGAAVARRVDEEVSKPFDLGAGPLMRACAFRVAEREHVLVLSMHHIVSDAWSMGIFVRELAAFYEEASLGRPAALPPLPVQYGDFGRWQRRWLQGDVIERQLAYWRGQLADLPVLELPTDRPRPPAQSFRGARHSLSFPRRLTERLKELSRSEGATLYMTLLAAFQALLMRYTGQEDIAVGSPIAGRNRSEIEGLIGFFVNTLVLRTDLSGDPTFRELLRRVREVALDAYAYQDLPFEKLVEELQPERDLGHNPLFQTMFALQNAPASSFELAGLKVDPLSIPSRTARFDLEVHVWERPDSLACTFIYATDLFDSETIVRIAGHFQTLLEAIVQDAGVRVSEVAILTEVERRQVLDEWNATDTEYPREATVHGLFEEQARESAGSVAVESGEESLTYGELNERSNRVARYLTKRGVGREELVGLCVERSVEMVVGLLGILKAGGAYVPLDPGYPASRLEMMLKDAGARVVVTQESLMDVLPAGQYERVSLDGDGGAIAGESGANVQSGSTAENLAYVIYTSGSTGVPKGVAIEHHSTVALLAWAKELYGPEELDGVLASTSVCFDLSVFELLAPLVAGGRVVLAQDALALPDLPAAAAVRLVNTVPSAMTQLLRMGELPRSVRTVNLAGEPLAPSLVREILQTGSVRRVLDLYGPTEDTTYSTCAVRTADGPATIGRPLPNKRAYILDRRLEPVPIGVSGDLYLAGAGVARGYLHRPELTAEKFLPDPFRGDGSRMYRSGDRARFLSDGNIQFLGRVDHQVKIRGYRIEIGEVEIALARHPDVAESAVVAREDAPGDRRLVAYVVARGAAALSTPELRAHLKSSLPDYMVPSAYVLLEKLPLTPNGKIDRRALPAADGSRPEQGGGFVAPRSAAEIAVARVWCEVLGIDRVGIYDNFFDLGGHSLLATLVFARLQSAVSVRVPLRTLFEKPTVAEFAVAVDAAGASPAPPPPSPIVAVSRKALSDAGSRTGGSRDS
ncbi:MAG: amino acid adenylation domain-containing protein [Acidobacteriota bacterium]